jgi:hypothetical protein
MPGGAAVEVATADDVVVVVGDARAVAQRAQWGDVELRGLSRLLTLSRGHLLESCDGERFTDPCFLRGSLLASLKKIINFINMEATSR